MAETLSVIVPTRNRRALLADAVRSIAPQVAADGAAELIIVDSASDDGTPDEIAGLARGFPGLRALRCPGPGLLDARHRGAAAAHGKLLAYVDDDVLALPGWLAAVREALADPRVALVGGPVRPQWDAEPPWWVELFRQEVPGGWTIWPLSLIDCGPVACEVPPGCVYGCNFALRSAALASCGGFHPDSVPRAATAWRGDGESALANAIAAAGHRVAWHPGAALLHRVSPERLTHRAFLWRSFCQGVSESYTAERRRAGLAPPAASPPSASPPVAMRLRRALCNLMRQGPRRFVAGRRLLAAFEAARRSGYAFHREAVARDSDLRAWVLRPDYLADAALPPEPWPVLPSSWGDTRGTGGGT